MLKLLEPVAGSRILDVGCGEGRLMANLSGSGINPVGVDIAWDLLQTAREFGPVVHIELPSLAAFRDDAFDAALVSLVVEHLAKERPLFVELGRVVAPGGRLALVVNHPVFTAPESAPIEDDSEVLWRPGRYFERGYTDEKAGNVTIRFHHRTMAHLLNAGSAGGWDLRHIVELGATEAQIERHQPLGRQRHIPRLLGVAWDRRTS